MKIYIAMVCDRHTDPEPEVFATPDSAIAWARAEAGNLAAGHPGCTVEEGQVDGWLYYATYCVEGDSVWVIEKTLDAPEGATP